MKKILFCLIGAALISASIPSGGDDKITFKEKAEQSKKVKVFFSLREIVDEYDDNLLKAADPGAKTPVRSTIPPDFAGQQIKDSVLKILNKGLELENVFVEGDISFLPDSKNKKTQFRDLSGLPDGFYALIDISGEYKRKIQKKGPEGLAELEALHSMEIKSRMYFFDVTKGEVDKYGDMFMKSGVLLGNAATMVVNSTQLQNIEWLETQFPPIALYDEYKKTTCRFLNSFTESQLKKHNKVVAKRK